MIIREKEPENLEFDFATLSGFLTPNEQFYVRSHFQRPSVDARAWRLTVSGAVERERAWTLAQLMELPAVTRAVTLECAGNNRVFLTPQAQGAQWSLGAVSTAEWTGVPLAAVLERSGLKRGAVDVVLRGADQGQPKEMPKPPGAIHYAHALPLTRVLSRGDDSVLLVYRMNGQPLPASHGFPVRAVVPGWYGMASVKWLSAIEVVDQPFTGYFQSSDYAYWKRVHGMPVRTPISEMFPKASIARPGIHEVVPAGRPYRVHGATWGGAAEIATVEVSTDAGQHWSPATLLGQAVPFAWRLWEFTWHTAAQPGNAVLMARATDATGRTQPEQRDPDWGSYVVVHPVPIEVEVEEKVGG